jgi:hypothetical protein
MECIWLRDKGGLYLAAIHIMTIVTFYHVNTYLNMIIS